MENLLANISWATFLITLIAVLLIYYAYIGFNLYDEELKELFRSKVDPGHNPFQFDGQKAAYPIEDPEPEMSKPEGLPFEETTEDTFERIETLIEALNLGIRAAALNASSPEQVPLKVASILASFPDLKSSPFKPAIHEMIHTACKNSGIHTLSEDDVARLWK